MASLRGRDLAGLVLLFIVVAVVVTMSTQRSLSFTRVFSISPATAPVGLETSTSTNAPAFAATAAPQSTLAPDAIEPQVRPKAPVVTTTTPSGLDNSGVTGAEPTPVGQTGKWSMIFHDEFDGSAVDPKNWSTCYWWANEANGCTIETNGALEWYQPGNLIVNNGTVKLRAEKKTVQGSDGKTYQYTSGMISSGGIEPVVAPEFTYTYGYAEIRARVPKGKGLWPAFWALPAPSSPRSPPSRLPEIDIMEILGDTSHTTLMNYHYDNGVGPEGYSETTWTGPDFSADWHTFALDWEPTAIKWYVDGFERHRYSDATKIASQPLYLVLDLAVGGDWAGSPDSSTPFPSDFEIDYVRVWQR